MAKDKIYKKVTKYLKQAIADNKMTLGDAVYSENQLCDILDVSRTSVRRAIREMVEDNILESRQGVGTFVKSLNSSCTVCLVNYYTRVLRYSSIDKYYTDFIYAAENQAGKENFRFQIFSGVVRNETEICSRMSHLNADGIILDGDFQNNFEDLEVFRKHYPNIVVLDGNPAEIELPSVAPDLTQGFGEILQIASSRDGRILFLYNGTIPRRRWALNCCRKAANKMKIKNINYFDYTENVSEDLLNGIDHGYLIMSTLDKILGKEKYSSIICGSDGCSMKVIEYLKNRNYIIPNDIAVSGVGGIKFSEITVPSITTLKIDTIALASTAVSLLGQQIRKEKISKKNLLPVQFLRRQSM